MCICKGYNFVIYENIIKILNMKITSFGSWPSICNFNVEIIVNKIIQYRSASLSINRRPEPARALIVNI